MFLLPGGHYYHEACVSFWFQENGGFLIFGGVFILASLIGNGWIKTPPPWGFSRTTPLCYWENYETVTIICSNEILKNHITVPIFRINLRYKFRFFGTPPPPTKKTNQLSKRRHNLSSSLFAQLRYILVYVIKNCHQLSYMFHNLVWSWGWGYIMSFQKFRAKLDDYSSVIWVF